jgi:thiosulfate dehydrogenase
MGKKSMVIISTLIVVALVLFERRRTFTQPEPANKLSTRNPGSEPLWTAPDSNLIPSYDSGLLISYGKKLITHTAVYFGPKGIISHSTNGLNCEHCHINAGTKAWGGNFGSTAALYPKFSERRNAFETLNQRIRDCFERSLNGIAPDSNQRETKAMSAYILWLGKDVPKGKKAYGTGLEILPLSERAADSNKGRVIYMRKCVSCHKNNGEGQPKNDSEYLYPPLWGDKSYNTSAGIYRLSKFAGFIKVNMPFGTDYTQEILSNDEAWDLAAFVNSQPRPVKKFEDDWPDLQLKPFDVPYGPYKDTFNEQRHKYGPLKPAINK